MNTTIYDEIKRRILSLEYEPGQILSEKALANEFSVSRTPVRESFLRLECEKLVTIIPRGGIMVTNIEFKRLRDLFLIRVLVEGLVYKLAAINIKEKEIHEILKLKDKCKKIISTDEPGELIRIDSELRSILHWAADSQALNEVSSDLYCQTLRIWYLLFKNSRFSQEVEVEINEIDQTAEILSSRDPNRAEQYGRKVMLNHIGRLKKYVGSFD